MEWGIGPIEVSSQNQRQEGGKGGEGAFSGVSSHHFDLQTFEPRVSNPRTAAYFLASTRPLNQVISLVVFVGYSVTYALHIAHDYSEAKASDPELIEKYTEASLYYVILYYMVAPL